MPKLPIFLTDLRLDSDTLIIRVLQISIDGPNVNWKFIRLFKSELRTNFDSPQLLELGSCGLHVVNGAFKTGIRKTDWNVVEFLRASFNLFKEIPSRRGDFIEITGCTEFPQQFCQVRWIENGKVSKKAIECLPNLEKYVQHVQKARQEPSCSSFTVVAEALKDKLLPAKLAFFQSLAEDLEPFLTEFQSNAPLAPFLHDSLTLLLKNCMTRFVKEDVMEKTKLHCIYVMKKVDKQFVNLKYSKDIDLGYATRAALEKCKGVSQKEILLFRNDCRTCLQYLVAKLLEKSPLKYPLTKPLTFLNPATVAFAKTSAEENLRTALDILLSANLLPASVIQNVDREYKTLLSDYYVVEQMKMFSRKETRLDEFLMELPSTKKEEETENLQKIMKMFFILSHGNAHLERGFSVNKEILVENLKEETLVANRIIHDAVTMTGGVTCLNISKELILSMRNAHGKWMDALEKRKKEKVLEENIKMKKRKIDKEEKELKSKKAKLLADTSNEIASIEEQLKTLRS